MGVYRYLYLRMFRNKVRKIVKKPSSLIYTVFIILYFGWLTWTFGMFLIHSRYGTTEYLVRGLCALTLYLTPANYASYARRKGLIFIPADVHFLFSSPKSGKENLLYAYGKTQILSLILALCMIPVGIFWFHTSWWKMVLYFLGFGLIDAVLQGSVVLLLYGNERFGERGKKRMGWVLWGILGSLVLLSLGSILQSGTHWSAIWEFLDASWINWIPLIGWSIAVLRLIFLGPDMVTVICSLLYGLSVVIFAGLAWKMRCTGEYYEEAMKFADDYQEARKRNKKGETVRIGQKKHYRKAQMTYKGSGARAIFYRQLLEYKKERFFIFGFITLVYLGIGLGIAWLGSQDAGLASGGGQYYIVPGALAYISFLFCSVKSRWRRELDNFYVFLMPEPAFLKMWYATLMDHIRNGIHGFLLAFPAMFVLQLSWWYLPVYVLMAVCMGAIALYIDTVSLVIFGTVMGDQMKRFLYMMIYLAALLIALVPGIAVTLLLGTAAGMLAVCMYLMVLAGLLAWAGSRCFMKMEN